MHKLDRDPVEPVGLSAYRHGVDRWSGECPNSVERQAIWQRLNAMQGNRCAYCEGEIGLDNRHIEHFRQRSRHPQGTFLWGNLFGSCSRTASCGNHKDHCGPYAHTDLIKPDDEDPEHYLVFAADGSVSPRANLAVIEARRATETIRIFNLDGVLTHIRRREVIGYVQTAEEFAVFSENFTENEWMPLLVEELKNIEALPFATAIRHVLTRQSNSA